MNKILLTALLSVAMLFSVNVSAGWEFSIGHDFYKYDEAFDIEEKGLPGVAVGYGFDTGTHLRTHYLGGDMYKGDENITMQHLRFDVEQDLYRGWKHFIPYAVMGISHREFDFNNTTTMVSYSPKVYYTQEDLSGTFLSAGLGFRIPLGDTFRLEADHRTMLDDNMQGLGYDGSMTNVRLSMLLGGKEKATAAPIVAPVPAPVVMVPTIEQLTVFFNTDSHTLGDQAMENIMNFITTVTTDKTVKLVVSAGYASSPGSDSHNLALSEARAHAVAAFVHVHLPNAEIEMVAMGEEESNQDLHNFADQNTQLTIVVCCSPE